MRGRAIGGCAFMSLAPPTHTEVCCYTAFAGRTQGKLRMRGNRRRDRQVSTGLCGHGAHRVLQHRTGCRPSLDFELDPFSMPESRSRVQDTGLRKCCDHSARKTTLPNGNAPVRSAWHKGHATCRGAVQHGFLVRVLVSFQCVLVPPDGMLQP
eukprot:1555520-Rhodomonas_salina.2